MLQSLAISESSWGVMELHLDSVDGEGEVGQLETFLDTVCSRPHLLRFRKVDELFFELEDRSYNYKNYE